MGMRIVQSPCALYAVTAACKHTADSAESMEERYRRRKNIGIQTEICFCGFTVDKSRKDRAEQTAVKHHAAEHFRKHKMKGVP